MVGETIWNWLQSAPPCSTIVTVTSVPPVATSVSLRVEDCPTATLPKSSGSGDAVNAARAAPLPPNQTASSNNPNQYLDIAMLPGRDAELPCHDRRRDYNVHMDAESTRGSLRAATFRSCRYPPTSLPRRPTRASDLRYTSAMTETPSGLQYEDTVVGTG